MMDSQLSRRSNKTCKDGLPKKIRIEQNRWEYEQICKSLRDGRCDDAINILLADTKELRSSGTIPFTESLTAEPHHRHDQKQQQHRWQQQQKQQLNEQMNATSNAVMLSPSQKSITKQRPTHQPTSTDRSKRDSVIMNLDKNRINVKRNKLLPRPLSLPISLKLFRNASDDHQQQHHQTSVNEMLSDKIDLDFIKRLEDDIYRTKNELYIECREKVVPKQLRTKTCYECNQVISTPSFAPNQITDRKLIEFKLSHFNKRQNAVLLLDAWQLQPMTMRRENNELLNFFCGYQNEREKFENKQYVVIVDNSSFYPVFMSYEIGKQKYDFLTEPNKPVTCECIDSDAYTRDFTRIFQHNVKQLAGQIQKAMPNISVNEVDSSVVKLPPANNSKAVGIYHPSGHNSSRLLPPPQQQPQQKPLSTLNPMKIVDCGNKMKKSRFENWLKIYSHSSLKNFMRKKKAKKPHTPTDVNPAAILTSTSQPLPLLTTKVINSKQIPNSKSSNVKQIITQKNQKLHWLLHTKPKIEEFKLRLRQRPRSHSTTTCDEILRKNSIKTKTNRSAAFCDSSQILTTPPNNYANEFRQLFHRISWSCSDLLDINRAINLRIMYLNRDGNVEHSLNKITSNHQVHRNLCDTPAIMNKNKKQRKSDRSVSLRRSKRYSVGFNSTMTDTVKAWVYRRRC